MRKTTDITIMENDTALRFRIKQMSATQSESWTYRLLMLLAQGAGKGSINELSGGDMSSVFGMLGNVPFEKVEALLDDLLRCCSILKDGIEIQLDANNVDGFIEQRNTLIKLRIEAFKFNDFFQLPEMGGSNQSPEVTTIKRRV